MDTAIGQNSSLEMLLLQIFTEEDEEFKEVEAEEKDEEARLRRRE